ncbi:metallophosphoesterase family protein [Sedimenticola hydrogenitrophicus]|uniref:metallophosphoesterase family protein n=1 Tax=Sedimenticola hydrogenitrophicus TaxID=2967975 RepID=UPI0023AF2AA8|nr:metallophosphoesterase family protein [Sedimenticola hydrogenitrophicus]
MMATDNALHHLGPMDGPLLLFGGPYGNLEALTAIRNEAERRQIPAQRIICTGDLTAYCASPFESVEMTRDWGIHVVMGNCEEALADKAIDCGCGFDQGSVCAQLSESWFGYTNSRITPAQRNWMRTLPRSLRFTFGAHSFHVVHGAPSLINKFIFPSTPDGEKKRELALAAADSVIGGHSGIPFGQRIGQQFWLNTGVIGLPANDGTPDGWYLLLEWKGKRICASWHRLAYDYQKAGRVMQDAGVDTGYARALSTGLWPSLDVLPPHEKAQQGNPINPPALWLT